MKKPLQRDELNTLLFGLTDLDFDHRNQAYGF